MAYKKVMFGNKEVELKATAATPPLFKRVFSFDLLKTLTKMKEIEDLPENEQLENGLDANELINKLGFIMAMQAKKADFGKMTIDDYYNWLDEFEINSIDSLEIMNLYTKNENTTTEAKKEDAVPSEI